MSITKRIYRRRDLHPVTGLSYSTIKRLMDDGLFPRSIPLSRRCVGWTQAAIDDWLAACEQSSASTAPRRSSSTPQRRG